MNNKIYWLRGILISLAFYGVVTAVLYPFGGPTTCDFICFPYWSLPTIIPAAIIIRLLDFLPIDFDKSSVALIFSSSLTVYTLVGILIGSIYGKIKNRKI